MIRKRIIFALLYSRGNFYLSRNFRLQKVGNINWIEKNYNFHKTCQYVDELAFILVTRDPDKFEINNFFNDINIVRKKIFSPIVIGGGIREINDVRNCFDNGADKILINTKMFDIDFINNISEIYGSQSISLIIDYKIESNNFNSYLNCGRQKQDITINEILKKIENTNYGEIIFHSIDRDGTGDGYDLDFLNELLNLPNKPILLMGGAGKPEHILNALKFDQISGVITANLLNFIGDGLKKTRDILINKNINIAKLN